MSFRIILLAVLTICGLCPIQLKAQTAYNTTLMGSLNPRSGGYQDIWGYESGGRSYALMGNTFGTSIIDVTDPTNPVEVDFIPGVNSNWRDIKTYQNYAYVVHDGNTTQGMQIIDLSGLPNSAQLVKTYSATFRVAHNLYIEGDYLYATGGETGGGSGGISILSLSNPIDPLEVGRYSSNYIHDVFVRDDIAYGAAVYEGSFQLIDVSNKSAPQIFVNYSYPRAFTHNTWLSEDNRFLFTTDESRFSQGGTMKVWDIRNLSQIQLKAEYSANPGNNPYIHNVVINGDFAYISHYTEGLRIVDVSVPEIPVEVGYYDTYLNPAGTTIGNWGVYPFLTNQSILLSDMVSGLYVVQFDTVYAGRIVGQVRDSLSGVPLENVQVLLQGTNKVLHTPATGDFALGNVPGEYLLSFSRFGYTSQNVEITLSAGKVDTLIVALSTVSASTISGQVTSATATPIANARVFVPDTPLLDSTDQEGNYSLFPVPGSQLFTLYAARFGFVPDSQQVFVLAGTNQVDFTLDSGAIDNFEIDQGWQVGAPGDDAFSGFWERGKPNPTTFGNIQLQPDGAFEGQNCYFTGQSAPGAEPGDNDVDGGKTSLVSPEFNLIDAPSAILSYARWFGYRITTGGSGQYFRARISSDGGSSWVTLDSTSATDANQWILRSFNLRDFLPLTERMKIEFSASDQTGNLVEAAVDDLSVQIVTGTGGGGNPLNAFQLFQNYPNPFNSITTIPFTVRKTTPVRIVVFNLLGKQIITLLNEEKVPGSYRVLWDGRDKSGNAVASGIYLYRLSGDNASRTRKLVLLR